MIRTLVIVAGVALVTIVARAQAQSDAEQAACKPDALTLCPRCVAAAIGAKLTGRPVNRVCFYLCFRAHRRELSPACDAVLRSHGY
jgi:hypothetical protein